MRGIVCTEAGKLFSVGYDRALCIWDTDHLARTGASGGGKGKGKKIGGTPVLSKLRSIANCHEGAISAVTFDPDNNWVITGSFDRCVKIWAGDGKKVGPLGEGFKSRLPRGPVKATHKDDVGKPEALPSASALAVVVKLRDGGLERAPGGRAEAGRAEPYHRS